jgi:tRNA(adenine34) deaminase
MDGNDGRLTDEIYMRRAIVIAGMADQSEGCAPIGCVIVLNGLVVGEGSNEVGPQYDPTAHAEIVAIRRATKSLRVSDLAGATLYSTLQPCGMCSMAAIWSKIGRIVYGAQRHQVPAMYFEERHLDTADFINDAFEKDISITKGVLSEQCAELYNGADNTAA